jgi:hypothetical protein
MREEYGPTMLLAEVLLVVAMLGVSGFGALALPPDAEVPVDFLPGAPSNGVPKTIGLVLWPAIGVIVYVMSGVVAVAQEGADAQAGITCALALVLVAQTVAVSLAVGHARRGVADRAE